MYYRNLNLAIEKSLTNDYLHYELQYFDEVTKLAKLVIENTPSINIKYYNNRISLNESIKNVASFFEYLNTPYSHIFQNILHESNTYDNKEELSVKFYKVLEANEKEQYDGQHRENRSEVLEDGRVHIDYNETLDDTYTIAHEITHKFSQPKNQKSTIKKFLGETSTITIEYLLEDYLSNKGEYEDETFIRKNNRITETYDDACALLFENILVNLYKDNNNQITPEILNKYLLSLDKNSKLFEILSINGEKYLNEIVKSGSLQFNKRQRYVIGTVLASDFHSKIRNDSRKKEELFYLIDILGHTDFMANDDLTLLSKLDIPIVKDGMLSIGEQSIKRLTENYRTEIKSLQILQNKSEHKL